MAEDLLEVLAASRQAGFLGPGPVEDHAHRSVAFAAAWSTVRPEAPPRTVLDLGSGGGVPGLVLAYIWPEACLTLLDGSERRVAFLRQAIDRLGLATRVTTMAQRAEEAAHGPLRFSFDLVVARGFAAPAVTAECGAAFVGSGGVLAVSEPPGGAAARWPEDGLSQLGLVLGPLVSEGATIQVLQSRTPLAPHLPRRVGVPNKRPFWS